MAGKLALIVIGYGLAVVAGILAVMANEMTVPADVSQASGGMVAFGDLVLFFAVTLVAALIPSWFLLRMLLNRTPRGR
ncbi:hypothetical protein [Aestuariivirga sp.]|uniref:hypothetical protein n=1 Tax=Aestuariivirga sp. TaxID=2650926 RepID=UPI0035B1CE7A